MAQTITSLADLKQGVDTAVAAEAAPAEPKLDQYGRAYATGRRKDAAPSAPAAGAAGSGETCPMDCDSLRAGRVSPACRQLMAPLYDACPAEGAATRADVEELAAWLFRTMPEPMRTEMTRDTVETVMDMPSTIREDWVRKLRAQRDQAL